MPNENITALKVKDLQVGVDKARRRFLVRFQVGPDWTPYFSIAPDRAADLSAAVVKRLSKLVVKH